MRPAARGRGAQPLDERPVHADQGALRGGTSGFAALLLAQILPAFSVAAPCQPGAALRDLLLVQRGPATTYWTSMASGALAMTPPFSPIRSTRTFFRPREENECCSCGAAVLCTGVPSSNVHSKWS